MTTRRQFIALVGGAVASPVAGYAQQPRAGSYRIGFLGSQSASTYGTRVEALRAGLREFGYVEGRNLAIEFRWAENRYERIPGLAAELVALKVDAIVTHAQPGVQAAQAATRTIPIVMAANGDVVAMGLVQNLARPGGNLTGSIFFATELLVKRLELIKEAWPGTTRAGVFSNARQLAAAGQQAPEFRVPAMEAAAKKLGVQLAVFEAETAGEVGAAFAAMAQKGIRAAVIPDHTLFIANPGAFAEMALKQRIATVGNTEFAEAGGVIGYGPNFIELFRRAAYFVDKVLKGTKAGDIPIEQASKFDMILNVRSAKALGLTLSQSVLIRGDKVIQ